MKDDYLWDGSGEPDPDIEQLEKLLGSYRYQVGPLDARLEQQLSARRSFFWLKYAAAAALILMAMAGAWLLLAPGNLPESELHAIAEMPDLLPLPGDGLIDELPADIPQVTTQTVAPSINKPAVAPIKSKKSAPPPVHNVTDHTPANATPVASELALASPIINPFVDAETARHIERAQGLLRSFRNTEGNTEFDLAYERQSSQRLLAKNVLLRRDAETKGNLPMEELLGSLEPFLLDIANLPDVPTPDDVRVIKARMEKKEIITALQVYSAPTLSRSF